MPEVAEGFAKMPEKYQRAIVALDKAHSKLFSEMADLANRSPLGWGDPRMQRIEADMELLTRARDKLVRGKPIARSIPLYGAPPRDVILPGWQGGGKEQVLIDAYKEAVRKTLPREVIEQHGYASTVGSVRLLLEEYVSRKEFNKVLTEELQKKGYKGILYSPHRYGEYELRMFRPEDVLLADLRRLSDPGLGRYIEGKEIPEGLQITGDLRKRTRLWKEATDVPGTTGSLRDIYQNIDLEEVAKEILLRSETPKELLPLMYGWREQVPQRTLLKQWDRLSEVGERAAGREMKQATRNQLLNPSVREAVEELGGVGKAQGARTVGEQRAMEAWWEEEGKK